MTSNLKAYPTRIQISTTKGKGPSYWIKSEQYIYYESSNCSTLNEKDTTKVKKF